MFPSRDRSTFSLNTVPNQCKSALFVSVWTISSSGWQMLLLIDWVDPQGGRCRNCISSWRQTNKRNMKLKRVPESTKAIHSRHHYANVSMCIILRETFLFLFFFSSHPTYHALSRGQGTRHRWILRQMWDWSLLWHSGQSKWKRNAESLYCITGNGSSGKRRDKHHALAKPTYNYLQQYEDQFFGVASKYLLASYI